MRSLLVAGLLLAAAVGARAEYAIVQLVEWSDTAQNSSDNFSLPTWGQNLTAGNAIVCWVQQWGYPTARDVTITGGGGGMTWTTPATSPISDGDITQVTYHYTLDIPGGSNEALTFSFSGAGGNDVGWKAGACVEISGIDTFLASADQFLSAPGSTTDAVTSGSLGTLASAPALILGFGYNNESATPPMAGTNFTSLDTVWDFGGGADYVRIAHRRVTATTAVAATFTGTGSNNYWAAGLAFAESEGAGEPDPPSITSVTPDEFEDEDTGIVIAGANFGSTQGNGTVLICPTDDVEDMDCESQTVTAWADDEITFTAVLGGLTEDQTSYLFVTNDDGDSNTSGAEVTFDSGEEPPASAVGPLNYYRRLLLH